MPHADLPTHRARSNQSPEHIRLHVEDAWSIDTIPFHPPDVLKRAWNGRYRVTQRCFRPFLTRKSINHQMPKTRGIRRSIRLCSSVHLRPLPTDQPQHDYQPRRSGDSTSTNMQEAIQCRLPGTEKRLDLPRLVSECVCSRRRLGPDGSAEEVWWLTDCLRTVRESMRPRFTAKPTGLPGANGPRLVTVTGGSVCLLPIAGTCGNVTR